MENLLRCLLEYSHRENDTSLKGLLQTLELTESEHHRPDSEDAGGTEVALCAPVIPHVVRS